VAAKTAHEGTQLVVSALDNFRSDCSAFGELVHEDVVFTGGSHHHPEPHHGKDEALRICKEVNEKMAGIETLSYGQLHAAEPGVAKDGMETITVILEKTTQVKFSKRIMTSPVAIDVDYKDGKIHRMTQFHTEARGLVQKYGDRYAGHTDDHHDHDGFMKRGQFSRFGKKAEEGEWEVSPECSKFADKGPLAARGCMWCQKIAPENVDKCMSCGHDCVEKTCDGTDPDHVKMCFFEKKDALKTCHAACMAAEPVQELEDVHEDVHDIFVSPEFRAHFLTSAFELEVEAKAGAQNP
jgi:hypothetical protein